VRRFSPILLFVQSLLRIVGFVYIIVLFEEELTPQISDYGSVSSVVDELYDEVLVTDALLVIGAYQMLRQITEFINELLISGIFILPGLLILKVLGVDYKVDKKELENYQPENSDYCV